MSLARDKATIPPDSVCCIVSILHQKLDQMRETEVLYLTQAVKELTELLRAAKIEPAINLSRPEAIFSLPSNRPLSRAACGLTSSSPQKARRRAGVSAPRGKPARPDVNFPRDPASWRAPSRYRRERNFVS